MLRLRRVVGYHGSGRALGHRARDRIVARMGFRALTIAVAVLAIAGTLVIPRFASADVVYLYDDLGRLARVIRDDGEAASYHYDAVGNILRITRDSGVPQLASVSIVSTSTLTRQSQATITISGTNLMGSSLSSPTAGITFQNVRTDFDQITADVVITANASLGQTTIQLTTALGTVPVSVTVNPAPAVITSFTPAFGAAGTSVTLQGAFDERGVDRNQVAFNGAAATVTAVTATTLTALVPSSATSGSIAVTDVSGTGVSSTPFVTGDVAVTTVSPSTATRGATVHISVTGSNLLGATLTRSGALFTNIVTAPTQVTADAAIALDAPRNAPLTISNQVASTPATFSAQPGPPTLTSFLPTSGVTGDTVTLSGSGFDEVTLGNNVVAFNGAVAEVVSATPIQLVVTVPAGATTGPITVTTPLGVATSATDFQAGPPPAIRLVATLATPFSSPGFVSLRPDGSLAYVSDANRGVVGVVDTSTHAIVTTIPAGTSPANSIASADGTRLYVVSSVGSTSSVAILDLGTNTNVGTISLSASSFGLLAITPDGRTLFVPHPNQGLVSAIDTTTRAVTVITAGGFTNGLAVSPDGTRLHVHDLRNGLINVVAIATRAITAIVPVGSGLSSLGFFTANGSRYVAVLTGHVTLLDTTTNTIAATSAASYNSPQWAALTPDGGRLYVVANTSPLVAANGALVGFDTGTLNVSGALGLTEQPGFVAVTPDGRRAVVTMSQDSLVAIVDAVTVSAIATVPLNGTGPQLAVPLRNNRHVYVPCNSSGTLCIVDIATNVALDVPIARTGVYRGSTLPVLNPVTTSVFGAAGTSDTFIAAFDSHTRQALSNILVPRAPTQFFRQVATLGIGPTTGATLFADNGGFLVFLDAATGMVLAQVARRSPSLFQFVRPDGARVFLLSSGGVETFDTASHSSLGFFATGSRMNSAVTSADGTKIYATDQGTSSLRVISTTAPSLVANIPVATSPRLVALSGDGRRVVVSSEPTFGNSVVTVIDTTTNTVTGTLPITGRFTDLAVTAIASRAFFGDFANNRVDVVDLSPIALVGSVSLPKPTVSGSAVRLGVTPAGTRVVLVQQNPSVVTVIDPTTSETLGTLTLPTNAGGKPVFGSNGDIYVSDSSTVFVLR